MKDASPEMLSLFCGALERSSADERAGYLAAACGQNVELRERIEALLRAHEQAGVFLWDKSAVGDPRATVDDPISERPGTVIGPYKLLEQIGEGGFGVVFMAEQQQPVRRKVALKILKPGMDTRQVVARFEAERQALAIMDHPHIAHVFDGGETATGRPYFVMELVRGIPITDFCDQNCLSIRERLKLFVGVCQAVQHAHQKGIIHRDLKPSNVMVTLHDGTPVVKVIDFGIAKATGQQLTDKTLFTHFAQMIGTPLYMSPEQAGMSSLDVDTRSDIYSLGVLLYELLTGTTPFDKQQLREASYDEIRRIIREDEPPRPSTRISTLGQTAATISTQRQSEPKQLSKLFRGELDWIVMKALEKDRSRRYETASALAADVRCYLNDEPVRACPPSRIYRLGKFARRNKTTLVTSTVVVCALVAGTAVATWQAIRAREAEGLVQVELGEKDQQFKRAEANFLKTLEAVDGLLTEVGQKELESVPQMEQVRRRLLEKALKFFQGFLQTRADDPTVHFEAGLAYRRAGDIQRLLGQHGPAEEACQKAIDYLDTLRAEHSDQPLYRHELARAYVSRASILADLGRREAMEQDYRQARDLLQGLAQESPDRTDYRADLASTCQHWGEFLAQSKPREAVDLLRQSARLIEELAEQFPERPEYAKVLVRSCGSLAVLLKDLGQVEEAAKSYKRGIDVVAKAIERSNGDQELRLFEHVAHLNYGVFLWRRGHVPDAEKEFHHAAKLGEQLATDFPGIPRYRVGLAQAYGNLGALLWHSGRGEIAEEPLKQGVALAEKLAADFPTMPNYQSEAGLCLDRLGLLLTSRGRHAEARTLLIRAMEHQEAAHALDPKDRKYRLALGIHAMNLALVLKDMKAPAKEVDEAHKRTITLARALVKDYPKDAEYHSKLGNALNNWAGLLRDRGQPEKAVSLLEEAVRCQKEALRAFPRNPLYLDSLRKHYMLLAEVLVPIDGRRAEEAYRVLLTASADLGIASDVTESELGAGLNNQATQLGDDPRALAEKRQLLEKAIVHQEAALARKPAEAKYQQFLGHHLQNLGWVLVKQGHSADAEKAYHRCLAVREKLAAEHPENPAYQTELAVVKKTLGEMAEPKQQKKDR